jgi:death-on-curing protein
VGLFLGLNGYKLTATQTDATQTLLAVASGEIQETSFAQWIRKHSINRSAM